MPFPSRVVVGLAVAVGAEELKVLDAVVQAVTVDVMEIHRQGLPKPLRDAAALQIYDTITKLTHEHMFVNGPDGTTTVLRYRHGSQDGRCGLV
jgi:hypothetical protein